MHVLHVPPAKKNKQRSEKAFPVVSCVLVLMTAQAHGRWDKQALDLHDMFSLAMSPRSVTAVGTCCWM